ncbi:MAG TPA: hypothetical protein ENG39_00340, partial [Candidatus Omnitrophica bacterium]|nr:hypothetical protein [Candidatus Omnitrophota bacterium]
MVRRKDILLYFIYLPVKRPNFITPIQIMKGLFLIKERLNPPNFYDFQPYLYGPCSFDVYRDLKILFEDGMIISIPSPSGWRIYGISSQGIRKCREMQLGKDMVDGIKEIKTFVVNKSFIELLRYIYEKYPK